MVWESTCPECGEPITEDGECSACGYDVTSDDEPLSASDCELMHEEVYCYA